MPSWRIIQRLLLAALLLSQLPIPAIAGSRAYQTMGWRPTAIPIVNFSSDDGAGYGVRTYLYEYDGESIPYRRAYSLQAFATTRGKWVHRLLLDTPDFRPGQRLEVEAVYEKEKFANYYGELDDAAVDALLGDVDDDTREERTTFEQAYPKLRVMWIRDLRAPWRLRSGLQLGHASITPNADTGSLLDILDPLGAEGGTLFLANASLRYDNRDDYNDSAHGILEEVLVEYGFGGGGDFNGARLSFEHRHFLSLLANLVLAHRINADLTFGDVPFYEELQLGGSSTVRGLKAARVRGQGRFLLNAELRWQGIRLSQRQQIYLGGLLFADAGQIFARRDGPSLDNWQSGTGAGLRFHWQSTVVRADYGSSGGRTGLYITFSQVF